MGILALNTRWVLDVLVLAAMCWCWRHVSAPVPSMNCVTVRQLKRGDRDTISRSQGDSISVVYSRLVK
jgi:hypothetical protein